MIVYTLTMIYYNTVQVQYNIYRFILYGEM